MDFDGTLYTTALRVCPFAIRELQRYNRPPPSSSSWPDGLRRHPPSSHHPLPALTPAAAAATAGPPPMKAVASESTPLTVAVGEDAAPAEEGEDTPRPALIRVVATGRPMASLMRVVDRFLAAQPTSGPEDILPVDYVIAGSGSTVVRWPSQEVVRQLTMPSAVVASVSDALMRHGYSFFAIRPHPHSHQSWHFRGHEPDGDFDERLRLYPDSSPLTEAGFLSRVRAAANIHSRGIPAPREATHCPDADHHHRGARHHHDSNHVGNGSATTCGSVGEKVSDDEDTDMYSVVQFLVTGGTADRGVDVDALDAVLRRETPLRINTLYNTSSDVVSGGHPEGEDSRSSSSTGAKAGGGDDGGAPPPLSINVVRTTSAINKSRTWAEILPSTVSKAQAIAWVAGAPGVPREATVAIGNDYNDIDMLQWAGLGLVVANAPEPLKAAFESSVASCCEGGVAELLNKWL
jgi:hydroxymethylpyrimidine pyrophosphatase-like HAD family hydrolase